MKNNNLLILVCLAPILLKAQGTEHAINYIIELLQTITTVTLIVHSILLLVFFIIRNNLILAPLSLTSLFVITVGYGLTQESLLTGIAIIVYGGLTLAIAFYRVFLADRRT